MTSCLHHATQNENSVQLTGTGVHKSKTMAATGDTVALNLNSSFDDHQHYQDQSHQQQTAGTESNNINTSQESSIVYHLEKRSRLGTCTSWDGEDTDEHDNGNNFKLGELAGKKHFLSNNNLEITSVSCEGGEKNITNYEETSLLVHNSPQRFCPNTIRKQPRRSTLTRTPDRSKLNILRQLEDDDNCDFDKVLSKPGKTNRVSMSTIKSIGSFNNISTPFRSRGGQRAAHQRSVLKQRKSPRLQQKEQQQRQYNNSCRVPIRVSLSCGDSPLPPLPPPTPPTPLATITSQSRTQHFPHSLFQPPLNSSSGSTMTPTRNKTPVATGSSVDPAAMTEADFTTVKTCVKASIRSHTTHTTADNTADCCDNHTTSSNSSPTPFRFTSFPASLPRITNPRTTASSTTPSVAYYNNSSNNNPPPSTVKKRMTFSSNELSSSGLQEGTSAADVSQATTSTTVLSPHPNHHQPLHVHQPHFDDTTQNTSISSMSLDGIQHHMPMAATGTSLLQHNNNNNHCSVPPTVLEWKSPIDLTVNRQRNSTARRTDQGTQQQQNNNPEVEKEGSINKCISGEFRCIDDNSASESPTRQTVGGTRLNFNLLLSPNRNSSTLNNSDREHLAKTAKTLPSQSKRPTGQDNSDDNIVAVKTTILNGDIGLDLESPQSPSNVVVHLPFHVDATQCSPIPGIPEEAGEEGGSCGVDLQPRLTSSNDNQGCQNNSNNRKTWASSDNTNKLDDEKMQLLAPKGSAGSTGTTSSSSNSSKMRKLRPMPDVSAFEAGSSRSHERSSDGGSSGGESRAAPPLPKLLCPPTPVRTPAWAHHDINSSNNNTAGIGGGGRPHHVFTRANSLIVTKVLATCPPQVLDGHSSLESSYLEEDSSLSGTMEQRRASLSFATIDDKEEEMEDMLEDDADANKHNVAGGHYLNKPEAMVYRDRKNSCDSDVTSVAPSFIVDTGGVSFSVNNTSFLQGSSLKQQTAANPVTVGENGDRVMNADEEVVSFTSDFETLGTLGSGAFADVYKARHKRDNQLYAIKRNRRRFRGKRDRDMALAEVRTMQRLQQCVSTENEQTPASSSADSNNKSDMATDNGKKKSNTYSLYLLFFFRAWQEEGYFFCQTELCCRDTCREMLESLRSQWSTAKRKYPSLLRHLPKSSASASSIGDSCDDDEEDNTGRLVPETTAWKICHDVAAGLSHIHSHGLVHYDIKPSNIFLVPHHRFGAMCKIGDFGMAGNIGTVEDGHEGDAVYMPPELLRSNPKHPSADIFSLGLTLYEIASFVSWVLPSDGPRWHELRSGSHTPEIPQTRSQDIKQLIKSMIDSDTMKRPSADCILENIEKVKEAGTQCDDFLRDYINDIDEYDRRKESRLSSEQFRADQRGLTPRHSNSNYGMEDRSINVRTPTPTQDATSIFTPDA